MAQRQAELSAGLPSRPLEPRVALNRSWLLFLPSLFLFGVFFVLPVTMLLLISVNPVAPGVIRFRLPVTVENFLRFFGEPLYYEAAITSIVLATTVAAVTLLLGYPLAYFVAKTRHPGRNTLYMILILSSMQLDIVIRAYGLMTLMGDNGLVNATLLRYGLIQSPLPLMYNTLGVIVGLAQFTLPFMVLSLIGIIRAIDANLEEAARSLGAGRWRAFFAITFPLSLPGVLSGFLLVFALSISSYVVPVLMGGWKVLVMPMHIYQQISELGAWQFGATIAVILFAISLTAVYAYHRYTQRTIGGLV